VSRARFVAAARLEFLAEVVHYAREGPHLGERFAEAVEEAVARAVAFPLAGSLSLARTWYVLVERFPFSVFYRPEQNGIVVFAVAHQARKPGYWRARVHAR
jgi:plasmid stabilization system protein ParE